MNKFLIQILNWRASETESTNSRSCILGSQIKPTALLEWRAKDERVETESERKNEMIEFKFKCNFVFLINWFFLFLFSENIIFI